MPLVKNDTRRIFGLATPAILSMISLTMVELVDAIFIGRLGPLPLAAGGLIMLLIWNIRMLSEGLGVGLTACVARMVGAKTVREASLYFRTAVIAFFALGIALVPVFYFVHPGIFRAMQMPENLFPDSREYLTRFVFFIPMLYLFITMESGFRAAGDTKTPMIIGICMNSLNVLLDWILVFGKWGFPRLEIQGAAIASGISYFCGAVAITVLSAGKSWGPFRRGGADTPPRETPAGETRHRTPLISLSHLRKIVGFGIPSTLERLAMSISQIIVMAIAVNPLGSYSVAGFHIVIRLASLSFMPGFGFSVAASTLAGQNLGAEKPRQAERLVWKSVLYAGGIFAAVAVLYFTASKPLISMFTDAPSILSIARTPLRIYAACAVFLAPTMVLGGGLRGAGETRFPMIAMFSSRFLVRLPLCWFLSIKMGWGLTGVWIGMCFDFITRAAALSLKFRQGKWKSIEV